MLAHSDGDNFWNVKEQERAEEDRLRREILELSVQLETISKAQMMRTAPGFQDFLATLQAQHSLAREKLVGDNKLTDAGLREQRGRVKGLESVLALLTKPQIQDQIAHQLQERKQLLADALRRRPKKNEQPTEVTK